MQPATACLPRAHTRVRARTAVLSSELGYRRPRDEPGRDSTRTSRSCGDGRRPIDVWLPGGFTRRRVASEGLSCGSEICASIMCASTHALSLVVPCASVMPGLARSHCSGSRRETVERPPMRGQQDVIGILRFSGGAGRLVPSLSLDFYRARSVTCPSSTVTWREAADPRAEPAGLAPPSPR
jgi:hypothetical protein